MRLVVGGRAQGKLAAVLRETGYPAARVRDGADCPLDALPERPVLNRLHLLVRRQLEAGLDPLAYAARLAREAPGLVVIADEVGCGVVPVDRFEREWREAAGQVCCLLARESERVDRVYAGIVTTIKGG